MTRSQLRRHNEKGLPLVFQNLYKIFSEAEFDYGLNRAKVYKDQSNAKFVTMTAPSNLHIPPCYLIISVPNCSVGDRLRKC